MKQQVPTRLLEESLQQIEELTTVLNSNTEPKTMMEHIVNGVCENSNWVMSSIMALDQPAGLSRLIVEHNPMRGKTENLFDRWPLDTSPVREVARSGKPQIIDDAQKTDIYTDYRKDAELWGYRTVVILPLNCSLNDEKPLVLSVQSPERKYVDRVELSRLSTFAKLASIAVQKANRINAEIAMVAQLSAAASAHVELMSLVLSGGSPESVTEAIAKMLQRKVIFIDLTSNSVTAADASKSIPMARSNAVSELLELIRESQLSEQGDLTSIKLKLPEIKADNGSVRSLQVEGQLAGALIVVDGLDLGGGINALVLQEVVFAASALLMRSVSRFRAIADTKSDLFSSLFTGNWRTRESVESRAAALMVDLKVPNFLLGINVSGGNSSMGEDHEYQALTRSITRLVPEAHVIRDLSLYVVIAPYKIAQKSKSPGWIDRLLQEIKWLRATDAVVSKSRTCERLEDYLLARTEIEEALCLAAAFNRMGLVSAADFGSHGLLLSVAGRDNINDFIEKTIGLIAEYDRAHGGEFLQTVKSFINSGYRLKACAESLNIHITTLRYRMTRLNELFGIDLQNPDTRFDLDLSLRLRELSQSH